MFQFAPCKCFKPTSPSGAGGAASSALLLGLDDVPASPAASRLASEAAALGANITVIMNTSTKLSDLLAVDGYGAIVTGSTRGIRLGYAEALASNGAKVNIPDIYAVRGFRRDWWQAIAIFSCKPGLPSLRCLWPPVFSTCCIQER